MNALCARTPPIAHAMEKCTPKIAYKLFIHCAILALTLTRWGELSVRHVRYGKNIYGMVLTNRPNWPAVLMLLFE